MLKKVFSLFVPFFCIIQVMAQTVTGTVTHSTTAVSNNGSITFSVTGGTAPYIYQWDDQGTTTTNTTRGSLAPGCYTIKVTDNTAKVVKKYFIVGVINVNNTVSIQPDAIAGNDAFVQLFDGGINPSIGNTNYPTTNFSALRGTSTPTGGTSGWYKSRSLLSFDFSSLPITTTILSANLNLYGINHRPNTNWVFSPFYLSRLNGSWAENTVTWNNQPTSISTDMLTHVAPVTATENDIFNVTSHVGLMVQNPSSNFGWIMNVDESTQTYRALQFGSSDNVTSTMRPKIDITFSTPVQLASNQCGKSVSINSGIVLNWLPSGFTYVRYEFATLSNFSDFTGTDPGMYIEAAGTTPNFKNATGLIPGNTYYCRIKVRQNTSEAWSSPGPICSISFNPCTTNPSISMGPINYCIGSNGTLNPIITNGLSPTYSWSPTTGLSSSTVLNPIISATSTTTYTLTVRNSDACRGVASALVTVNPLPTISGTLSACVGATTQLTGSATANVTAPWTSSNTTVATVSSTGLVSGISAGTAIITYKNSNGCTITATVTINANPIITGTLSACVGATTQLTGSGTPNATTPWTSSNTSVATVSNTGLVTGVVAGSTNVTYKNSNNCTVTVSVTINANPTITGTTPSSNCVFTSSVLSATASAGTINWYSVATGGTSLGTGTSYTTPSLGATTTYYVDATINGCVSTPRTAVTATKYPIPVVSNPVPASRCGTGGVMLAASVNTGVLNWYATSTGGSVLGTGSPFPTPTISSTTTYYVEGSTGGGACVSSPRMAITATINPIPTITVNSETVCAGSPATLTATPSISGGTYLWNTGASTSSITVTPGSTTSYSCVYTLNGCSSTSVSGTVTVNPVPSITVNSETVCAGSSATLTAIPSISGGTYLWNTGATTASITITPGVTTSYSCVYTLNGCSSTSVSGTVTVNPVPVITVNSATICAGSSTTITATPSISGGTYLWNTGATTSSITVTPGSTTSYSCVYTLNGCSSTSVSGTVTVNPVPSITVNSETVCAGAPATLTATPSLSGGTYLWNTGATTASITITPGVTTSYSCVYTLNGCSSTSVSGTVSVNPVPSITVNSETICAGSSATLTATPSISGGTYLWNTGATTSSITITPGSTTSYSCVYTLNGCSSTSVSGTVTVNLIPAISVNSLTICAGSPATLTATPSVSGGTYLWNTGATTASITIAPVSTTNYSCVYTLNGCSSTSVTGTVTVNPVPIITINNATIYAGISATLTAVPTLNGGTYLWNTGATTNSITVSPVNTTTYTCVYTLNGCSSPTGTGIVTVAVLPKTYARLERHLTGVNYTASNNKLYFSYDEEYSQAASLTYRVLDKKMQTVLSQSATVVKLEGTSTNNEYGDNRFQLNVNSLNSDSYILEVTNEKQEKFYLRFTKP